MLTVHHLENSRSHRIIWLLEELALDYQIEHYKRDPKTRLAPAKLRELHPLGKSPILTDDGRTIAESAAIIEYLVDRHGTDTLRPPTDSDAYLQYRYWLHYAEGSAMPPLVLKLVFHELPRQSPWLAKPLLSGIAKAVGAQYIDPQIRRHLQFWEQELSSRPYFAGDQFSAADIQMSFALASVLALGFIDDQVPAVSAHLAKIRNRPAYQRAVTRGGGLDLTF